MTANSFPGRDGRGIPPAMMIADLHIHSKYSRATSQQLDLEHLWVWAQKKGLQWLGTGDFTHPAWLEELKTRLVPDGRGFYRLSTELAQRLEPLVPEACKGPVRFVLQTEVSCIYKVGGRVRKVHNVVMFPDFEAVDRFNHRLERIGNLSSDGRPILGLDSRDLLEIALESSAETLFIPAHIWTPWFSALGSKSGFDSIQEAYRDLSDHIFAVETGLSSDPPMNWKVSSLDSFALISNSDAHSPERLGREASVFDCESSYQGLYEALRTGLGLVGTLEFFPEEGKYHLDGHRACQSRLEPARTRELSGLCPVCGRPVTVGVLNRVETLADRAKGCRGPKARDFESLLSLDQILAENLGLSGRTSKRVQERYLDLLTRIGPELHILREASLEELAAVGGPSLADAVGRVRTGRVYLEGGYDGEFGLVRVMAPGESRTE